MVFFRFLSIQFIMYDYIGFDMFYEYNTICQCVYKQRNLHSSEIGCFNLNKLPLELCVTTCILLLLVN
jgi:hypothetical protein